MIVCFYLFQGLKGYDTCGPAGNDVSKALEVIYKHKFGQDTNDKLIGKQRRDRSDTNRTVHENRI